MPDDHDLPLAAYHHALHRMTNGDPGGYKELYSGRDDVTLANPFGPPVRGREAVWGRLDDAATHYGDGEVVGFENVVTAITSELAYIVEIERFRARVGGAAVASPVSIRVTTVFRCEDDTWRVVHRHADPITTSRAAESVMEH